MEIKVGDFVWAWSDAAGVWVMARVDRLRVDAAMVTTEDDSALWWPLADLQKSILSSDGRGCRSVSDREFESRRRAAAARALRAIDEANRAAWKREQNAPQLFGGGS